MQNQSEAPKQLTRGDFFKWFFQTFKIVESKQLDLANEYGLALPDNCDFWHLRDFLQKYWRTINSPNPAIPSTKYLLYNCRVTHLEPEKKCEALIKAEEARKQRLENQEEYDKAAQAFFEQYHKKYGQRRKVQK